MPNRIAKFTTNQGEFKVELFEEQAPGTTKNFIDLVEKEYYDGIVFHRVIAGFMIQGGCPTGNGTGGPGYTIADEFHAELRHDGEGVLSMANAGPNTGGSQFFVTLAPTAWLDGKHAVFGKVVEGLEMVRAIGNTATGPGDRPLQEIVMEKVEIVTPGDTTE
jgi:peptidyl-prolyl cis-trans isomerase A (cyclophilin A)